MSTESKHTQPVSANTFHAGNTCPHCQELVAIGQLIVSCANCGAIHHDTCWVHKGGCSSYHCDKATSIPITQARPEIVIRSDELANVQVPVLRQRRSPRELSEQYLPKAPIRTSRLAIASVIVSALAVTGILGAVSGNAQVLTLGIVLCLVAIVLGVVSLVIINNTENRVSGTPMAVCGVVLPVSLTIAYFATLSTIYDRQVAAHKANLNFSESLPTDESLARMPPARADAMRANVIIKSGNAFNMRYGSGIVLRIQNNRAYILTNKHVVGEGVKSGITTIFYNGEESSATVAWAAPDEIDLTIVQCDALTQDKFHAPRIARELLATGEKVFAIGNPMGLSWSYTEGMISGQRTSAISGRNLDIYQTQTPINSGNSGGGLYAMDGRLVGVNTWTEDKSVAEGINFSIAIKSLLALLTRQEIETMLGSGDDVEL